MREELVTVYVEMCDDTEMAKDTAIVTMECEETVYPSFRMVYHFQWPWVTLSLDFKVTGFFIDIVNVFCAQLTRDLFAIAKFLSSLAQQWKI